MNIKRIGCILFVIVLSSFFIYYYIFPFIIAKAFVSEEYLKYIPQSYQQKFQATNNNLDEFISKSQQNGISIEDLLSAIDEVKEQEVRNALDELNSTKLHSVEQVFNIVYENIKIKSFDPVTLKPAFLKHVKMHHIHKILNYIKTNNLESNLTAKSAKRIAKQVIIQKKDKIMKKSKVVE